MPTVIKDVSDTDTIAMSLIENIQREDLNSIEEARGYDRLRKEFNYDQDKIASFLKDAFWIRQNMLPGYNFDQSGNLSFGISDYTDFPDQKYDPDIGIFGMDVNIVLERPGHRVSRRRRRSTKVARNHRVIRDECKQWFVEQFGITIVEE